MFTNLIPSDKSLGYFQLSLRDMIGVSFTQLLIFIGHRLVQFTKRILTVDDDLHDFFRRIREV